MKKCPVISVFIMTVLILTSCSPAHVRKDRPEDDPGRSYTEDKSIESFYYAHKHAVHRIGAKGPDAFDCSGFTQSLFSEIYGIELPRTSGSQYFSGNRVKNINELSYGDLVFFNTSGRGVSHVGVYLKNDIFVHASSSLGVTKSNIRDNYWRKRFLEGRRVLR
ncbi:MAG: C40 family peptidase [Candidatus Delongbacteria bacterium]